MISRLLFRHFVQYITVNDEEKKEGECIITVFSVREYCFTRSKTEGRKTELEIGILMFLRVRGEWHCMIGNKYSS